MDADAIARDAVDEALFMLKAAPVPSGTYRAIIEAKCMPDMLGAFSGVFSAESAQKGLSLLAGKEGEMIASEAVTLMDDPLLPGGLGSQPFDAEGVATRTKAVIENGKLTTLLHNLKTARKAGVKTTGNAAKAGYAGAVNVRTGQNEEDVLVSVSAGAGGSAAVEAGVANRENGDADHHRPLVTAQPQDERQRHHEGELAHLPEVLR